MSTIWSLSAGSLATSPAGALQALIAPDGSTEHLLVRTVRAPRTLAALLVGAAMGASGAILQSVMRNHLASPGLLGVNGGAALAVIGLRSAFGILPLAFSALAAALGGMLASLLAYTLAAAGGKGAPSPLRLVLAGAMVSALCAALTTALLILDRAALDDMRVWLAGSLAGRDWSLTLPAAPWIMGGLLASLALARTIAALALGDHAAAGLGVRVGIARALAVATATLLAGASVALAGPVGFIGLVAPHIARLSIGTTFPGVLLGSMAIGASLLAAADATARIAIAPSELPVGIITALLGAPAFLMLLRRAA
ncbi:MAG: iron ABC transporter permease [Pseudomonadota bacterium]